MRLLRIARWWLPISGSIWSPSEDPSSVPASECSALITLSQLDPVQASDLAWVAAWRRATALAVIRTVDGFVLFDTTICHVSRVGLSVRNSHSSWCLDPAFTLLATNLISPLDSHALITEQIRICRPFLTNIFPSKVIYHHTSSYAQQATARMGALDTS
jgi:hypothetical protein